MFESLNDSIIGPLSKIKLNELTNVNTDYTVDLLLILTVSNLMIIIIIKELLYSAPLTLSTQERSQFIHG